MLTPAEITENLCGIFDQFSYPKPIYIKLSFQADHRHELLLIVMPSPPLPPHPPPPPRTHLIQHLPYYMRFQSTFSLVEMVKIPEYSRRKKDICIR